MSNICATLKKEIKELKQLEMDIQKKKDELVSAIDNHLESIKKDRIKCEGVYNSIIK